MLLKYGANINAKTNKGETPFQIALSCRNYEVIDILLEHKGKEVSFSGRLTLFALELSLVEIDSSNSGIYHHLVPIILSTQGMKLYEKICKLVGPQNDLYKLVDANGFTPLLLYIQEFAMNAEGVYNECKERLFHEYQEKQASRLSPNLQNPVHAADYKSNNTQHLLTPQEAANLEREAQKEFDDFVTRFLEKLQFFVNFGSDLRDTVQKSKINHNFPKSEIKTGNDEMVEEIKSDSVEDESVKQDSVKPIEESNHFEPQESQTALHIIMRYPHSKVVKFLLEKGRFDVNQQDRNDQTALNLLINSYDAYA